MSKDIFDNELDNYLEDKLINECTECGKLIKNKGVCSEICRETSMI